jgi:hypothetical protein
MSRPLEPESSLYPPPPPGVSASPSTLEDGKPGDSGSPEANPRGDGLPRLRGAVLTLANGAFLLLLAYGMWSLVWFGNLRDGAHYLQGERLVVEPRAITVADGRHGEDRPATIRVRNLSGHSVEIMGANVQCTCVEVGGLPVKVAARGSVDLPVKVHFRRGIGNVDQVVTLYTTSDRNRTVAVSITGNYIGDPQGAVVATSSSPEKRADFATKSP